MNRSHLPAQAGSALVWKTIQLVGVKVVFLVRIVVLGRLLSPDDFGLFAISLVAIGFLTRITDFGMVPALIQKTDADDRHYNAAWTVNMVRTMAVGVIVFLAAPIIARLFAEPRATDLIRVLALQPILNAAASIRLAELTRDLRFRSLAFIGLPEAIVNTMASIVLVEPLGVWALVVGPLAGSVTYVAISYVIAPHRPRFSLAHSAIKPLFRYGRWIFLTGLFVVTGNMVLQLVIARRLGVADLGLYFLATRLAFLPAEVSSQVVGTVAFPVYSRVQSNARLAARAFRSILLGTAAILVPASLLLVVLAPSLIQDVLGPRWEGTAQIIGVLALVNVVGVLGEAVIPVLTGVGAPQKQTVLQFIQFALLIVFVWELAGSYGVLGAALAWLPAIGATQIVSALMVRRILVRPFTGVTMPALAILAASITGAGVAWAVDALLPGPAGLAASLALALSVTAVMLWSLDRRLHLGLAADLARTFPAATALMRLPVVEVRS